MLRLLINNIKISICVQFPYVCNISSPSNQYFQCQEILNYTLKPSGIQLGLFPCFLICCLNTSYIVICVLQKLWQPSCSSSFLVLLKDIASSSVKFNVCDKLNDIFPALGTIIELLYQKLQFLSTELINLFVGKRTECRNFCWILVNPCQQLLDTSTQHFLGAYLFLSLSLLYTSAPPANVQSLQNNYFKDKTVSSLKTKVSTIFNADAEKNNGIQGKMQTRFRFLPDFHRERSFHSTLLFFLFS